jgi:hypothetical protein
MSGPVTASLAACSVPVPVSIAPTLFMSKSNRIKEEIARWNGGWEIVFEPCSVTCGEAIENWFAYPERYVAKEMRQ